MDARVSEWVYVWWLRHAAAALQPPLASFPSSATTTPFRPHRTEPCHIMLIIIIIIIPICYYLFDETSISCIQSYRVLLERFRYRIFMSLSFLLLPMLLLLFQQHWANNVTRSIYQATCSARTLYRTITMLMPFCMAVCLQPVILQISAGHFCLVFSPFVSSSEFRTNFDSKWKSEISQGNGIILTFEDCKR